MPVKIIGACLIVLACGIFGFSKASSYRKEMKSLAQLLAVLNTVECELEYRMTPLPELCLVASESAEGDLRSVFKRLAKELQTQILPDAERCMHVALVSNNLPTQTSQLLHKLGRSMGKFDVNGQLNGIRSLYKEAERLYIALNAERDVRIRSYRTLGLCAGVIIAILLI